VKFHNIIVKFYNLEQTIEKIEFKFSENTCIKLKKIGLVRPMGNTLRVRLMGNSETNGQHFFEKLVCCPLVSPIVSLQCKVYISSLFNKVKIKFLTFSFRKTSVNDADKIHFLSLVIPRQIISVPSVKIPSHKI
jgi:hypothetical protein